MSRWGRGRGGSVALPLDTNLFRENSNCPSASRSAGTVGKWGITSFTSLRSAPYAFPNNVVKKPVQDQNSPLTVPVESEAPPPKPKKFFKSRNQPEVSAVPQIPQITYAPPVSAAPLSPEHPGTSKGKSHAKKKKSPAYCRDSSPDEPKPKNSRKKSVPTKAAKKEDPSEAPLTPNKRYLVRNRTKINYAEDDDRSNSPIRQVLLYSNHQSPPPPQLVASPLPPAPPQTKVLTPKASPTVSSPIYVKPELLSPTNKEGKPPIVLRISKGTSRIVSTDSNEGLTSPNSDRHSSLDNHWDSATPDHKSSPSTEPICSPKHEGLKITIKCPGLKEIKKKDKKHDDKKSHKKHHKNNEKPSSPQPGTDNYDLYRTLASPPKEESEKPKKEPKQKEKLLDDIESELARLNAADIASKSHRITEPQPEPKPPEKITGRSMRHRPAVNYNENDDLIDMVTANKVVKHLSKKEIKKSKKKSEPELSLAALKASMSSDSEINTEPTTEENDKKEELLEILGDESDVSNDSDKEPLKLKINKKAISSPKKDDYDIDAVDNSEIKNAHSPESEHVFKAPDKVEDGSGDEKPSVKLVITKKKGSIFKSKSLVNDQSGLPARRRRHLYKHQWADDGKGNQTPRREPDQLPENPTPNVEVSEELTKVTRYRPVVPTTPMFEEESPVKPYTSVKCPKESKEYYTVVRNVKKAHQIQEIGEFQEFNDEVEYILDALQDNNPMSTRCLSAIKLASKCTTPAFRMHVRAHGTVQKFFSALHDAANDQSLGLCTATVMFVLSQDRLNMDLDRESLELMLNLLESDVSHRDALEDCGLSAVQLDKNKERVRELCAEIKIQGKAKHLDLDNITVGHLAMETLLSLTSKRAGEWFKEELRALGGVDHIVRTIQDCVGKLTAEPPQWSSHHVDILRKADRCMRVLENITQQNEENQLYLVCGERAGVAGTLAALLALCCGEARRCAQLGAGQPAVHAALLDAALPAIKVLINLSHLFPVTANAATSLGANVVGQHASVMENCLIFLNNYENFVPDSKNFEFCVCVLLLLINLVQNNPENIARFLSVRVQVDRATSLPALDFIVEHFFKREELARRAEENTDAILDGEEKEKKEDTNDKKKQSQDDIIEETVAKLLAKAGTHMEHCMVGAYAGLLLGNIALASPQLAAAVRARLPLYKPLLPILNKYYSFLNLTASAEAASVQHVKATQRIIDFMVASDKEREESLAPPAQAAAPALAPPHSSPDMPQDMSFSSLAASYGIGQTVDYSMQPERINASMDMRYQ